MKKNLLKNQQTKPKIRGSIKNDDTLLMAREDNEILENTRNRIPLVNG
jgi:hypothetical protein